VEIEFWTSIKETDECAMFEAYLRKYPKGEFKSLAEIRLQELGSDVEVIDRR